MKKNQLEFTSILNDAFAQYERQIVRFMAENKAVYEEFARAITPNLLKDSDVYSRVAFAILSANSPFEDSVKALNVVMKHWGRVKPQDIVWYKQVPAKAKYLNALAKIPRFELLRQVNESWHDYRVRLQKIVKGLGMAKASFAACLLYPLDADLACVDTWIQRVFLGHTGFRQLSVTDYLYVEAKIRTFAHCFGVSTFLAQWLIWDHARGSSNSHAIFPGSHK